MWWVWLQKHKNIFWAITALALTFAAGWQAGRVSSPYYAAHPIVFQGSAPEPQALEELQVSSEPSIKPSPSLQPSPQISPASHIQGQYVASVNSDLYHDQSCPTVSRIKPENQVWFASRESAEAAGYSPSACTKEKLGL